MSYWLVPRTGSFAVYGATTTSEVWASEDSGENCAEIISGLPPISKSIYCVLLDPLNTWLGQQNWGQAETADLPGPASLTDASQFDGGLV